MNIEPKRLIEDYIARSSYFSLTQADIQDIWYYKEGVLYWKRDGTICGKGRLSHYKDTIAGCICKTNGYCKIRYKNQLYKRSRLIFLLLKGYLPDIVDHINRIRSDDRIENLREVTATENNYNRSPLNPNSITGYKNIHYDIGYPPKPYKVNIAQKSYGRFASLEEALTELNKLKKEFKL